jgi:hypothetical protein
MKSRSSRRLLPWVFDTWLLTSRRPAHGVAVQLTDDHPEQPDQRDQHAGRAAEQGGRDERVHHDVVRMSRVTTPVRADLRVAHVGGLGERDLLHHAPHGLGEQRRGREGELRALSSSRCSTAASRSAA